MTNSFLQNYGERINTAVRDIDTYSLMGSSDTKLDLANLGDLLRGAVSEIKKLQKENDTLKDALRSQNIKKEQ